MNARLRLDEVVDVGRDVSRPVGAPSAPVTAQTTTQAARCDRTIDHLPHDTDQGDCPGYLDPERLTTEEIHDRVEELRREATAYGYRAGFADRDEGREYSNAWETNDD